MLYLYSLLNLSSVIRSKDLRQNTIASSNDRPSTYASALMNHTRLAETRQAYLEEQPVRQPSKMLQVTVLTQVHMHVAHARRVVLARNLVDHVPVKPSVVPSVWLLHSEETPARNPCESLSSNGTMRVSSFMLGRHFAVI